MNKSVVLLSGGMDSFYSLLYAKRFSQVQAALFFNYSQTTWKIERTLSKFLAHQYGVPWEEHIVPVKKLVTSPLLGTATATDSQYKFFVPGRNMLFYSLAAMRAYTLGADSIYAGICSTAPTAYPDCKLSFVLSMQDAISRALGVEDMSLLNPAISFTRADIFRNTYQLFGQDALNCMCFNTVTGYSSNREQQYRWGYGPAKEEDFDNALRARADAWWEFEQWKEQNETNSH